MGKVTETVNGKEASFHKWKSCPNENKKEHKFWQGKKKSKKVIKEAKKVREEKEK